MSQFCAPLATTECSSFPPPLSPLRTYMSSGVMVTTPSADLDFAVPLLLLLLLSALFRASSAAPRSSFSNRPCVAASMEWRDGGLDVAILSQRAAARETNTY